MCYFLYKNGKNKQLSNISTHGKSNGRQPGNSSTIPVTVNQSYGTHIPANPSLDEDPTQTIYEAVSMC